MSFACTSLVLYDLIVDSDSDLAAKTEITEAERVVPLTREQRLQDISFEGVLQAIDMDDDGKFKITKGECERAVSGKFEEQFKSNY